ncbi:MAG TPA: efflux RND transporter periplasmic adaptor subunit [Bryobacteraceae bacterium]|nr:efflux RND transporter periplasmic adaptor subunit [Bryobacteraceae bacterium]
MWKPICPLAVIVMCFLALLTSCAKEKEKEVEAVAPVEVTEVKRDSIERRITAEGILRALDQSAIMPKISAPVRRWLVNRGDHVRKGQLLAELENRDLAAAVVDSKGAYEQAAAGYRNTATAIVPDEMVKAQQDAQAAKQSLDAAQKLLASREQLYKEGALARKLVDEAAVAEAQARGAYETARKHLESLQKVGRHEEVKGAAGQVESAKGKLQAAQAQLSYSEIRSPISGVVAERGVFAGEIASTGAPLITVMDVSSVIARINVPQAQASFLRVGQPATITATDGPDEVQGKVTVVSPAVDPNSTTVEVWVQALNRGERLRPGGTVRVAILAGTVPDAVVAPPAAVLPSTEGGTTLMVVSADSLAHERKVEVGIREPEKVQLLSGAKPGERVIVNGGVGLQDGAKVKVVKAGEKPDEKKAEK